MKALPGQPQAIASSEGEHLDVAAAHDHRQRHLYLEPMFLHLGDDVTGHDVGQFSDHVAHILAVKRDLETSELLHQGRGGLLGNAERERPVRLTQKGDDADDSGATVGQSLVIGEDGAGTQMVRKVFSTASWTPWATALGRGAAVTLASVVITTSKQKKRRQLGGVPTGRILPQKGLSQRTCSAIRPRRAVAA